MRTSSSAASHSRKAHLRLRLRSVGSIVGLLLVFVLIVLSGAAMPAPASKRAATANLPRVAYLGPREPLKGITALRASSSTRGARIVAVTFLLDGKPLGSDTTGPYRVEVDTSALPAGAHRLCVAAVDSLGRRVKSPDIAVTVVAHNTHALTASPTRGLRRALARLARGGVNVRLGPGNYRLSGVLLGSNTRLYGSGASTVISAPVGSYSGILMANGRHVQISDLTLDGSGAGPGDGIGVAIRPGAANVRIARLTIGHVRQTGVGAWGSYRDISVQDSVITGDGHAGAGVLFGEGRTSDLSVIRTHVSGFRSFGINFVCVPHDNPNSARDSVALDNVITDVTDPSVDNGTSEGGIWSGGIGAALIGNVIRRTGWDGIETVGSSRGVKIVANSVRGTKTGIYLEHATNKSYIGANRITKVKAGIDVEWRYDGVGSNDNSFVANTFSAAERGIFIDVGDDGNRIERNIFLNVSSPVILQGSSYNIARGNRACGPSGRFASQWVGKRDNGVAVTPRGNRISDNRSRSCSELQAREQ